MQHNEERGEGDIVDRLVHLNRVAKVVKGGRRFSFSALVVAGDGNGRVGAGLGKANEVPEAIRKGIERAKRSMIRVPMVGQTIPHEVLNRYASSSVMLRPAAPGTGVIAGQGARAVLEAAGIRDILTKSHGTSNVLNVTLGTFEALKKLKSPEEEARRRGKPIEHVMPFWTRYHG